VTSGVRRGLRFLAALSPLLLFAACGANSTATNYTTSNYGQLYQLAKQSWTASFGHIRVTKEQAAAVPYASLGFRVDGGNENMVVLATDTGGDLLWTSAAKVVLVTHDGRIVRSVGLPHDLAGLNARDNGGLPPPSAAMKGPVTFVQLEDFPDLGHYGAAVTCRSVARGRQSIVILGQSLTTVRIDETCHSDSLGWSFVDTYWVDATDGTPWRTRQHLHPSGEQVETEILRPPG
jgi:hypothetical protein